VPAPSIAIIVPTLVRSDQQLAFLAETLATVTNQSAANYELVIVSAHPYTRCIRQKNAGPAVARNTGVAASTGEYLIFLDSDDYLLPDALATLRDALTANPECGFVVGPREEMTYDGSPVPWSVASPPREAQIYTSLLAFDWYIIPPSCAMFRRTVVEAVGGFQNPWGPDDLDFYLRVARRYRALCFQSPAVTRYRRYSTSTSRDGARMLSSIRVVYERQRPLIAGSEADERAFDKGLAALTSIFIDCVVENLEERLRAGDLAGARSSALVLQREDEARWQDVLDRHGRSLSELLLADRSAGKSRAGAPPSGRSRQL
jgi:hypothetical protein